MDAARLEGMDLVITSYGSLLCLPWLASASWRLLVLDEAQAIKNPDAKQTRAVKALKAQARIALTGTPVENRLSDLWSIFDFINPGLLGRTQRIRRLVASVNGRPAPPILFRCRALLWVRGWGVEGRADLVGDALLQLRDTRSAKVGLNIPLDMAATIG